MAIEKRVEEALKNGLIKRSEFRKDLLQNNFAALFND